MADKQIHELTAISRSPESADVLALDTGSMTGKMTYSTFKTAVNADAIAAVDALSDVVVHVDEQQVLTDAQKATACENIGAVDDDDLVELENTVNVALAGKADAAATETALAEKVDISQGVAQAGKAMIVGTDGNITTGGAVRFDAGQDLTDAQKVQARSNTGAAGVAELNINILPYPYSHATETVNGITYTDNGDGTITASGTATSTGTHVIAGWEIANGSVPLIEGNAYLLSGCPAGGDLTKYFVGCRVYENGVTPGPATGTVLRDFGDGVSFHGYKYVSIYLAVIAGTTVSNLVFRPMLRQASISADAYAPYGESLFGGGAPAKSVKVSIIGDSISTYDQTGYKVDGYAMYYPNHGVTDPDLTWWMRAINANGAALEVNASYSGSCATSHHVDRPDFYARCAMLGEPDVIYIALGTNDSGSNVDLGEYDFDTTYTSLSEATFRTAYIKGVKALQANYPNAQIVLVILSMEDSYAESITHIGNTLGCVTADVRGYNGASGVHPGVLGMRQIASKMIVSGAQENETVRRFDAYYDVNLLNKFVITNMTTNGLTFTVPGDGTVHVSGTASKATTVGVATFSVPEDGTYKFNGQQVNNLLKNSVYVVIFDKTANTTLVEMKNVTATATCLASHVYSYRLYFANGANCGSDLVFMPMVHSNGILPPFQPRYGDNALAAYVAEADGRMNDRSECYMPDYSDMLDQTGGKLPYKIRGKSLTVYAPTSTPTDTTGSLIFGDMSGLREGEWYDLRFDYFNTSTKNVYLTFIAGKGMNTNYGSVKNIAIPASSQGTMQVAAYQHRFQYKYFRLYYSDFSSGSNCTIANLKVYKKSMLMDGAIKDVVDSDCDVMNPVYGAGMSSSAADPTVILADNMYYAYHTGGSIVMLRSPDLVEWERCGGIFGSDSVAAIKAVVGADSIGMWAPNIIRRGDGYLMYFNAVENNNTANNCHMMVARAAHPGGPWVYAGEIFNVTSIGVQDCIDADVVCTPTNELYMFFGSTYGMYVCKLTDNGLALDTSFEKVLIHTHSSGTSTKLEGAMLHFRQQTNVGWYYYLITSCGDYAKTGGYHLTVSRSTSLTGPYLDKSGNSIVTASNVGTNLLTGSKELLSPGHCSGIFTDKAGRSYILCHAYRSMDTYRSLCLVELHWGDDGWPYVGETTEISTAVERPKV